MTTIVSVVLAALLTLAAVRKLTHSARVVESYRRAGVPENRLNLLAAILLTAAAALIVGLFWPPLAIAASTALIAYFLLATLTHIRAHDTSRIGTPLLMAALSTTTLTLHLLP